jgi:3'5'-cyclic nucleotide phosphodiesterase
VFWRTKAQKFEQELGDERAKRAEEVRRHSEDMNLIEKRLGDAQLSISTLEQNLRLTQEELEHSQRSGSSSNKDAQAQIESLKRELLVQRSLVTSAARTSAKKDSSKTDAHIESLQGQIADLQGELRHSRARAQVDSQAAAQTTDAAKSRLEIENDSLRLHVSNLQQQVETVKAEQRVTARKYSAMLLKDMTRGTKPIKSVERDLNEAEGDKEAVEKSYLSPLQELSRLVSGMRQGEPSPRIDPGKLRRSLQQIAAAIEKGANSNLYLPDLEVLAKTVAPGDAETAEYLNGEMFHQKNVTEQELSTPRDDEDDLSVPRGSVSEGGKPLAERVRSAKAPEPQASKNAESLPKVTPPVKTNNAPEPKRIRRRETQLLSMSSKSLFKRAMSVNVLSDYEDRFRLEARAVELFDLKEFSIRAFLGVSSEVIRDWVHVVSENYGDQPYHNFSHAIDVAHTTVAFFRHSRLQSYLTNLDKIAITIAALCHDIGHPGRNNVFECGTLPQCSHSVIPVRVVC